ncbi:lysosome membrane protein 2-like [Leptidea sinapis]|nr:lysosome membrane protein 2-like [Leptidea sinapis]
MAYEVKIPTIKLDETTRSTSTSAVPSPRDSYNSLITNKVEGGEHSDKYDLGKAREKKECRRSCCCSSVGQSVWGVLLIAISIGGFIVSPLDILLWEKLNMREGLPPYEWWSDPPDELLMRIYIFNVTNHDRFLNGLDAKINVEEIGPIVYLEKLLHSNETFNENSTLSYKARRFLVYLPEKNTINLNSTIVVPNLALLGIASRLYDANYFMRTGFKFLANSHGSTFFNQISIYQYLWDYQDSILETTKSLAPNMVPTTNMGVLKGIYEGFADDVTVMMGPKYGHENFFKIVRFNNREQLKGYNLDTCPDRITGATEGVMYHQRMKKTDVLKYLRKTICRTMSLHFDEELTVDNVPVYRFNLSDDAFNRIRNGTDCYDTVPSLPDGVTDTSKCFDGIPMVASYPHFYTGLPHRNKYVTGLKPDKEKHNSYVLVEPLTGTPFRALARMQCNLRVQNLSVFHGDNYDKFSELIIPLTWIEYSQEGLPNTIRYTIYFMVVILPPLSTILLTFTLVLGFYYVIKQVFRVKKDLFRSFLSLYKEEDVLCKNKVIAYETESFLKVPS